jgi:hypothetical protein
VVWIALVFVQVVMALTPLVEARGGAGASPHVEARGDARHYAHADANCAFCAVRTIHAAVAVTSPSVPRGQRLSATIVALALLDPSADAFLSNLSRAPPRA